MNGSIFLSRELYDERAPSQGYIGDGKPRKGVDQRAGVQDLRGHMRLASKEGA